MKNTNGSRQIGKKIALASLVALFLIACSTLAAFAFSEKQIEIVADGQIQTVSTREGTVAEVLAEANITLAEADQVTPELSSRINNNETITVDKAVKVKITADWQTNEFLVVPQTVGQVLASKGITLSKTDVVTPSLNTKVIDGTNITVKRVKYLQRTDSLEIQPKVVRKSDPSLGKGQQKVLAPGQVGKENVTYEITYVDGKPIDKVEIARTTVTPVQDRVVAYGTTQVASRNGRSFTFSRSVVMRATAYTHTGNRTATGTVPKVGTVAVDPNVIPLGTKLYVEGYGYAVAEDTGGVIKGNRIDVFLDTKSACRTWGVKSVRVYVLD